MAKLVDANSLAHYTEKMLEVINDGDELSNSVTVELGANGTLGGYKTGDSIAAGTPIETVIKKLLAKQVPPTYTQPSISIANNSGTAFGNYEIGTLVTPNVKTTFTKNDAGALTEISILKNGSSVATSDNSPATYNEDAQTLSSTISFSAIATYEQGPVKNDNLGDPYPSTRIAAGTKTSSALKYTPYRQGYFYGVLDTTSANAPLNSAIIRACTKKNGAYASNDVISISAASVANRKRIFVACPANKTGVKKVIMPSAMNADCTADFVKQSTTVMVEGANGYTAEAYNVWIYEPASISDDQTFSVTLG